MITKQFALALGAVLTLALAACCTTAPFEPMISTQKGTCDLSDGSVLLDGIEVNENGVAMAIQTMADYWPGPEPFPCPTWRTRLYIKFVGPGILPETDTTQTTGMTTYLGDILVLIDERHPTVGRTALTHELTHWALWRSVGDFDPTHEEESGPWTDAHNLAIEAAQQALRDSGY